MGMSFINKECPHASKCNIGTRHRRATLRLCVCVEIVLRFSLFHISLVGLAEVASDPMGQGVF